jgi:hypothetical protein
MKKIKPSIYFAILKSKLKFKAIFFLKKKENINNIFKQKKDNSVKKINYSLILQY